MSTQLNHPPTTGQTEAHEADEAAQLITWQAMQEIREASAEALNALTSRHYARAAFAAMSVQEGARALRDGCADICYQRRDEAQIHTSAYRLLNGEAQR